MCNYGGLPIQKDPNATLPSPISRLVADQSGPFPWVLSTLYQLTTSLLMIYSLLFAICSHAYILRFMKNNCLYVLFCCLHFLYYMRTYMKRFRLYLAWYIYTHSRAVVGIWAFAIVLISWLIAGSQEFNDSMIMLYKLPGPMFSFTPLEVLVHMSVCFWLGLHYFLLLTYQKCCLRRYGRVYQIVGSGLIRRKMAAGKFDNDTLVCAH